MVTKRQINPVKKIISATFSYLLLFSDLLRIERNDKILLVMKRMVATEVHSSINVVPLNFRTFNEVSTRKQIPSKFAEVFKMCGALLLFSGIPFNCVTKLADQSFEQVKNALITFTLFVIKICFSK